MLLSEHSFLETLDIIVIPPFQSHNSLEKQRQISRVCHSGLNIFLQNLKKPLLGAMQKFSRIIPAFGNFWGDLAKSRSRLLFLQKMKGKEPKKDVCEQFSVDI